MPPAMAAAATATPLPASAAPLTGCVDGVVVEAPDLGDCLHQLGVEVQAHAWEAMGGIELMSMAAAAAAQEQQLELFLRRLRPHSPTRVVKMGALPGSDAAAALSRDDRPATV